MEDWIINVINQYGYLSIILLIAVENIFPPIPSEVILTFGGFLTTYTYMNPWWVIVSATVGSLVGAVVLYLWDGCWRRSGWKSCWTVKWEKFYDLKKRICAAR